jgi:hypothetical protein
MMSDPTKRIQARESKSFPPLGSARRSLNSAPKWFETLLHIKGFAGGVPLNTETAALKPRVGIAWITKRCLFFVEMARAGGAMTPPALLISRL